MGKHSQPELAPTQLPYPEPLNIPGETVGREAVDLANLRDWHQAQAEAGDRYARRFAEAENEEVEIAVAKERRQLDGLTLDQKTNLSRYAYMLLSEQVDETADGNPQFIDYLRRDAPTEQFVTFLRRHTSVLAEQLENGQPFIEQARKQYITNVFQGITDGWISRDATTVYDTVPRAKIEIVDYWQTHNYGIGGVYHRHGDVIYLPQGLGDSPGKRLIDFEWRADHVFDHEFNHREFGDKIFDDYPWLDEGLAEHVRLAMRNGEPGQLHPAIRGDSEVYRGYRALLHYLTQCAPGTEVPARVLTLAYTSNSVESPEWQTMEQQLSDAWGSKYVLDKVTMRLNHHRDQVARDYPDMGWAEQQDEAAIRTKDDLASDPSLVFIEQQAHKQKPQTYVGSAALVGAGKKR
ncbi:MAG TPA: hypothetical protein VD735_05230 [Candidatus Saccharimonadales bacterium]|nr:hypothetical protein [Candidatus Saccharimonadales bacterium]